MKKFSQLWVINLVVILGCQFICRAVLAEGSVSHPNVPILIDELTKFFEVDTQPFSPDLGKKRVLVIDKGFKGFVPGSGLLPDSAKIFKKLSDYPAEFLTKYNLKVNPDEEPSEDNENTSSHGLKIAQAAWAINGLKKVGPEFVLVQAETLTDILTAFDFLEWSQPDVVIYAQNSVFAGNGDGTGPIDAKLAPILRKLRNTVFVCSAGNYGRRSFSSNVITDNDSYLKFYVNDEWRKSLDIKVERQSTATIELVWDKVQDDPKVGTDRDLDLYVYDENNELYTYEERFTNSRTKNVETKKVNARAERRQKVSPDFSKGEVQIAREKLTLDFKPNTKNGFYHIYIRNHSNNFNEKLDQFRVVVTQEKGSQLFQDKDGRYKPAFRFVHFSKGRNVYAPADLNEVYAIGDLSDQSSEGPTWDERVKPDGFMPAARLEFEDGTYLSGTSISAGLMGGIVTRYKSNFPDLTTVQLKRYTRTLQIPSTYLRERAYKEIGSSKEAGSWDDFKARHTLLYAQWKNAKYVPVGNYDAAARVVGNYPHYGIGYNQIDLPLIFGLQQGSKESDYEFYIALDSKNKIQGHARKKGFTTEGLDQPYPWEDQANPQDPDAYLQIKRIKTAEESKKEDDDEASRVGRVWVSPSTATAKIYFGNNR